MVRNFYDTIFRQIQENMVYTVTVLDKLTEYKLPPIYQYANETFLTHYHYDVLLFNLMEHKTELFYYKGIMCDQRIVKYCMMFDISVFNQMLKFDKKFTITYDSIEPFLEINGNIIKFDKMQQFRNNVQILEHSLRVNPEAIVWLLLDDSIDYNNVGLLIHTARNLIIDKSLITFPEKKVKRHPRGRDIRYPSDQKTIIGQMTDKLPLGYDFRTTKRDTVLSKSNTSFPDSSVNTPIRVKSVHTKI